MTDIIRDIALPASICLSACILDYSKPFILSTNASDSGIGAFLFQIDADGKGNVIDIVYASRVLTKTER